MQCALSPPLGGAATARSVAQRLKESSLKDGLPSSTTASTSGGRSPRTVPNNISHRMPSHPPLTRRQQNTIRIIAQYLRDLGLHESVESLVEESGCKVENAQAVRLKEAIMRGNWNEALSVLEKSYAFLTPLELESAKVIILEEKFYELVHLGENPLALKLLREEYPSKKGYRERKLNLTNLIFGDPKTVALHPEVKKFSSKSNQWKRHLAVRVQKQLDPSFMLPFRRLEHLTEQAFKYQVSKCRLHFEGDSVEMGVDSIFQNHTCVNKDRPLFKGQQIIKKHSSEVWCLEFSPDGSKVASGSKNGEIIIWQVDQRARKLVDPILIRHNQPIDLYEEDYHSNAITCLSWSYDGRLLAVNGGERAKDGEAIVYNTSNGCSIYRRLRVQQNNVFHTFSTLSFVKQNKYQLIAANKHGHIQLLDLTLPEPNYLIAHFEGYRVNWLYTMKDSSECIVADSLNRIRQFDFPNQSTVTLFQEESEVYSFAMHSSERYLMLVTKKHNLRIWDLHSKTVIRSLFGINYDCNTIHVGFGGPSDVYTCGGSLDGSIAVWNIDNPRPLAVLERAHRGLVNAVKWSPSDVAMLVSAGDDRQIRVFVANLNHCVEGGLSRPPLSAPMFPNTYGWSLPDKVAEIKEKEKNGKTPSYCMTTQRAARPPQQRLLLSHPGYSL